MFRTLAYAFLDVLFLAGTLSAFEAVGTIQKVDAAAGMLVIHAGNQDRTVKVVDDVKVLDAKGKPLPEGLRAKELIAGVEATFTIEPENGGPRSKPFNSANGKLPRSNCQMAVRIRSASSRSRK